MNYQERYWREMVQLKVTFVGCEGGCLQEAQELLDNAEIKIDDVQSKISDLESAIYDLKSEIDDFSSEDWRDNVPDV